MCPSSLQVNVSALWACTFFRWWWWKSASSLLEDERDVCVPLWIHYSQFRCLLHTPLLCYIPPFHLAVLTHRYSTPPPPLSCQIPASMAQWSHLLPETSTNRITMMLKGLWWGNWDKSVKFCSGCCTAPTRTNWFPRSKSHSQHSGT